MSQIKRALLVQFCGLVVVLIFGAWAIHHFPVTHYLTRAQEKIGAMQFWGGVLYPLLYAACNVLLLPGGILAIGSGLFFGLWWGVFLNVAGNVTGAAISFLISRKLGRGWVEKKFFQHRKWVALDAAIERDGWKIIFLSQVHPLFPSSLLNYLYGITRIRFGTCMLWIALGQAPGLFLYAYLGTLTQLGLRLVRGQTHPHPIEYVIWIGGLVVTLATTTALARIALRLLSEME
ncbi:MAG: TVP38/TMEM64 family protein, partial [Chthoniobacteraceae bacterium]